MAAPTIAVALILALSGALGGCGWTPVYADRETTVADEGLRAIRVNSISERLGQRLEMALRSSLNPDGLPTKQRYALTVTLSSSVQDFGVQSQGLGTRGGVQVYATYILTDLATSKQLQISTLHSNDSFDIQANGYSTVVAEDDAYTRTVEELRREIVTRLTLFLQHQAAS